MHRIQLKISDLARVAEVTRFQAGGLVEEVFSSRRLGKKETGSHRIFTPQELLVFVVAHEIEQKHGVRRSVLAMVGEGLRQALNKPRSANREARLLVTFTPASVTYLEHDARVEEGLVVRLGPLFAKTDEYLGVSGPGRESTGMLPLRPVVATGRRGGSRSR